MIEAGSAKQLICTVTIWKKITGTHLMDHNERNKLWRWDLAHCLHNELGHSARYGLCPAYTHAFKQKGCLNLETATFM